MPGSRAGEALRRFVDSQNEALNCLSVGRLAASARRGSGVDIEYVVRPARIDDRGGRGLLGLRATDPVLLDLGQVVAIRPPTGTAESVVQIVTYAYQLLVNHDGRPQEILAFHWTPDAPPPQLRRPHLHVGSLVTAGSGYRPKDFNKLHIPTGLLSLEAVLLFAVEELGVEPARGRDRGEVIDLLREGDRASQQSRAREPLH